MSELKSTRSKINAETIRHEHNQNQNNNIFADIENGDNIKLSMLPDDIASLNQYKRQIELDYREKVLDLQRQRDVFEQDQRNAKIEMQQRELILKQDQAEVKAEHTKIDVERAQLHLQQLELDQNIKQYEAKKQVFEQEYSACVNILHNLGSARPSINDSCRPCAFDNDSCPVRPCIDDNNVFNGDGDSSSLTLINDEDEFILNKGQSIALGEYVSNIYTDLEQREEKLKAQLQLLKRGHKQLLADTESLSKQKHQLEHDSIKLELDCQDRLTRIEKREKIVQENLDGLNWYENRFKIPLRNDLKTNHDAWKAIDDKYQKDQADADEKNKGKPEREHVEVDEPTAIICYKFVNVDKQLIVSNPPRLMPTPLCDIFHQNNYGLVGLWEHFFERDYGSGIFPPKNDKLKLFVQSEHVLNNEWIQIYGFGTSLPGEVVLSHITMCDPNKKNPSLGVSHHDRCILSKDECGKQHKSTDINYGFFHSNPHAQFPYEFVINVKWEVIDE